MDTRAASIVERIPTHEGNVGGLPIRRALPTRARRMIGAWCFLDHIGPSTLNDGQAMRVAPHPHIGLQTFSWMIEGEVLHRDSLGCVQTIRPGQVNLMTAGRGVAHSEEMQSETRHLHMVQLWIALPEVFRTIAPAFVNYPTLPVVRRDGVEITVLAGTHADASAPTQVYSPLVGLDIVATAPAQTALPLEPRYEHGLLVLEGEAEVDGQCAVPGTLLYLGARRDVLPLRMTSAARLLLLGGAPFEEDVLLWWNFVARRPEELRQAAVDWNAGRGPFGRVEGYEGEPLAAPDPAGIRLTR
ncbi:MAG: pirin family protein [Burkholderiales bacterium]